MGISGTTYLPLNNPHILKDIFKIWYNTQKYIEVCKNYQENELNNGKQILKSAYAESNKMNENFESEDIEKLKELRTNMIDILSNDCAAQPDRIVDDALKSREWLQNRIKDCSDYHDEYDIRVRYLVETSLGRNELKYSVKLLKECCNMTRDIHTYNRQYCESKWISALKYYKALYSCLTLNVRNTSSCMFLSNTHTN